MTANPALGILYNGVTSTLQLRERRTDSPQQVWFSLASVALSYLQLNPGVQFDVLRDIGS